MVVVYKVDRLTRSLADFAKLVELFDAHGVSFVSVTQAFNTTNSMGRLTLNVLLSFAQFEREVTGERIRDKIAASKKKGLWMGGVVPLGYRVEGRKLRRRAADGALALRPLHNAGDADHERLSHRTHGRGLVLVHAEDGRAQALSCGARKGLGSFADRREAGSHAASSAQGAGRPRPGRELLRALALSAA
jgi:hypothetical protein